MKYVYIKILLLISMSTICLFAANEYPNIKDTALIKTLEVGTIYDIKLSKKEYKIYIVNSNGIGTLDISKPKKIFTIDNIYSVGGVHDLEIAHRRNMICVVDDRGLNILSKGSIRLSAGGHGLALSKDENIAYIAGSIHGLQIVDIHNPKKPTLMSNLDINGAAIDILLSKDGKKLYVSYSGEPYYKNGGLKVIDVSDVYNPIIIAGLTIDSPNLSNLVFSSSKDKIYAISHSKLKIIDITEDTNPKIVKSIQLVEPKGFEDVGSLHISKDEKRAYVATCFRGFQIINIEDLENISIQQINLNRYAEDVDSCVLSVAISEDEKIAYIGRQTDKMLILDLEILKKEKNK